MSFRQAFHYNPGESLLHRWDPRCKLAAILLTTFCLLSMKLAALGIFTLFLMILLPAAGLSVMRSLVELRAFLLLLAVIFLSQALLRPGPRLAPGLPLSAAGTIAGALTCWRLLLMMGYGMTFVAVTRHQEVSAALQWTLELLRLPGRKLAFMASLTVRFIPQIVDAADLSREAARARAADRAGWLRRARAFFLPLVRRTLLRSEDLTLALASRCWDGGTRARLPRAPLLHLAALVLFALTVVASLYLEPVS